MSSVDPVYLGVSESAAGPFDPMYQMQFMRGFTYRVHNVDTTYSVGISSDDGTTMVVAAVGPGATLTVVANTLTAGVYSYQVGENVSRVCDRVCLGVGGSVGGKWWAGLLPCRWFWLPLDRSARSLREAE